MLKVFVLIRREFMVRVRTKWFVFSTLFVPIVMVTGTAFPPGFVGNEAADVVRIVVVDSTTTMLGGDLARRLNATGVFFATRVSPRAGSGAVSPTVLGDGSGADAMLFVGANTLASGNVSVVSRREWSAMEIEALEAEMSYVAVRQRLMGLGLSIEETIETLERVSVSFTLVPASTPDPTEALVLGFALWFLLYVAIMVYGMSVMGAVVEEKASHVIEVLLSSVTAYQLLAGKILGVGAVGLLQMGLWLGAGLGIRVLRGAEWGFLGQATPSLAGIVLVYFVGGYLVYAALFAAVASTVDNEIEAKQAQFPVVLMLLIPTFLLAPVLNDPSGSLAVVLGVIPFTSPVIVPVRWLLGAVSGFELAFSLAALTFGWLSVTYVAAKIYRIGILARGSRPSLVEVLRWVRQV